MKWIVPKEGIAVAWSGHTHGAPSDYRCNSYVGFLLLNGDFSEAIFHRMKENNIQSKLLDWLQTDGFLYSRKYTWDKVYKSDKK